MKCLKVKKKLAAYLDGEVSEKEQQIISEHVRSCASCQQELEALSAVSQTLDEIADVEVAPYFRVHLKARLRGEKAGGEQPFSIFEWKRKIAIPVAAAALFIFSIVAGRQLGRTAYQQTAQTTRTQTAEIDYLAGLSGIEEMSAVSFSTIYEELYTGGTE